MKILEKVKALLIRYIEIKEGECKVIGDFVKRNLYWIDADIYERVSFDSLIRAVNAIETELKSLGLSRGKICLTRPGEDAVLRISFPMPYYASPTFPQLVKMGLISPGEVIFGYYKGRKYEAKISHDGRIVTLPDNEMFDSPSGAASHITHSRINGWYWWRYKDENGEEHKLNHLRVKYRQLYDC